MPTIMNISGYHFMAIEPAMLPKYQIQLKEIANDLNLKGTILLSPEGINIALAGLITDIQSFQNLLKKYLLKNLEYRVTYSENKPFQNLFVKIKKQIIPFPESQKPLKSAPYLSPSVLRDWLNKKHDVVMLDTRNQYEVEMGSFQDTTSLNLNHFKDFPTAIQQLPPELKQKTIVTFCTGGIRCEKASSHLLQQDFKTVYQLQGGILNYFDHCQNQHYQGGCFVFDERKVLYPPSTSTAVA